MFGNKVGHLGRVGSLTLAQRVSAMFSRGEQGAWYDPSDMSTLFQDSAGTTPVTAVEQPVGRMLDKSGRGNHATQSTTTKRPVYSRRVNLLVNSEFVGYTVGSPGTPPTGWANATLTGQIVAAPVGVRLSVSSARRSFRQTVALGQGAAITARVRVEVHSGILVISTLLANLQAHLSGTTYFLNGIEVPGVYSVPVGVHDVAMRAVVSTSGGSVSIDAGVGVQGNATGEATLFSASLTLATDANLPYQWVNTATDYDADPAKFPAYLRFDGVDDALVTVGNVDLSGTDKVAAWAGVNVNNLGDAGGHSVVMHKDTGLNAFLLFAPTLVANAISAAFTGNTSSAAAVETGLSAPNYSAVLTCLGNLVVTPSAVLRRNALQVASSSAVTGGGMFSNAPLYVGSQTNSSRYFNGRLYGLIVRGGATGMATVEAVERYMNSKTRAY